MNDEKHLRELIQAALDGKQIEAHWTPTEWISAQNDSIQTLIRNIASAPSSYRIKPEVKTFTYQTRVYMLDGEEIGVWNSTDGLDESQTEHFYQSSAFSWIAESKTHTIEYTE
jgi:hypothetical protein